MDAIPTILSYALYLFLALAVLDAAVALIRHRGRDPKEALANLGIYVISRGWRDYVTRSVELAVLFGAYALAPHKLPATWWAFALTVLAADFVYYWKHRSE